MAKAKFDIPNQIPAGATRPLYAGVGVTDLVVGAVRDYVADVQKRLDEVQKTITHLDVQPQALRDQATKAVSTSVETFGKDAQTRRRLIEQRVAALQSEVQTFPTRLQKLVDEQVATAGDTYSELVKRGESLVGRIRRQQSTQDAASSAETTVTKAKTTRTQAAKTASSSATTVKKTAKKTAKKTTAKARKSPARSSAKATRTAAAKTASSAAKATTDAAGKIGS
jgi:heparin binding hemagglutinin HbhA